eukprot:s2360_g8.t1
MWRCSVHQISYAADSCCSIRSRGFGERDIIPIVEKVQVEPAASWSEERFITSKGAHGPALLARLFKVLAADFALSIDLHGPCNGMDCPPAWFPARICRVLPTSRQMLRMAAAILDTGRTLSRAGTFSIASALLQTIGSWKTEPRQNVTLRQPPAEDDHLHREQSGARVKIPRRNRCRCHRTLHRCGQHRVRLEVRRKWTAIALLAARHAFSAYPAKQTWK